MERADTVAAFSTEEADADEAFYRDRAAVSVEFSRVTMGIGDAMWSMAIAIAAIEIRVARVATSLAAEVA
jgi:hypothetical protein